jgi:acetyl-CoA carboxylase carboxyltransferase component
MGLANIDGRPVAVGGEDFTIRGDRAGRATARRAARAASSRTSRELSHPAREPDRRRGRQRDLDQQARPRDLPRRARLRALGRAARQGPVVSAVLGTAAGGPAGRAILSHWSVMVDGTSQVFAAGPPVVERSLGQKITKEDLGGPEIAVDHAGTIDNRVETEDACFAEVRRFLSYMPSNVWEQPPSLAATDPVDRCDDELLRIVPKDRRKPYNMRKLIGHIVDKDSLFEIQPTYGKALITALARMNGKVVGIVANNPMVYGGAMDVKAARKQIHFVEMCDCFHIPLVFLVDVPGFMVGRDAEANATLREGMRAVYVGLQATVPTYTVVIRKCYGMAGMGRPRRTGWSSRSPGRRPNGARCRSKAAWRRRSGARSPARPMPRRASASSRPSCAQCPPRSAPPRPSASRRSSIRARRAPISAASSMPRRRASARPGTKSKFGVRP